MHCGELSIWQSTSYTSYRLSSWNSLQTHCSILRCAHKYGWKQVKLYLWICPGNTSIPVYRLKHTFDFKNSNLAMLAFKKNSTPLYQKWAPFHKSQLTLYKTRYAFFCSPLGQGVMPTNLLPLMAPWMEPSYMHAHIPQNTRGNSNPPIVYFHFVY